jgi:hypothetical protein
MPQGPRTIDFYSTFGSLLRTNRFRVTIPGAPTGYSDLVESIELPSMQVATTDYILNTQIPLKIPYTRMPAQSVSMTFRMDQFGAVPATTLVEIDKIFPFATNIREEMCVEYPEKIWKDIKVEILEQSGNRTVLTCTFLRAVISTVEPVQYSFEDRDTYARQTITWTYQDMFFVSKPPGT